MTEAALAMPRRQYQVLRELEDARYEYNAYLKIAADAYALDTRPMFYDPVAKTVTRIGELPMPDGLREALETAAKKVAELTYEYHTAMR